MELSITEQLTYTTIRIECVNKNGETQTGTGFFFQFLNDKEKKTHVPVVITNKHVVKDTVKGKLIFSKADSNGNPIDTDHWGMFLDNFESFWRLHPNSDVDICAMAIAPFLKLAEQQNVKLFYRTFSKDTIPNETQKEDFTALEDILMIGYPNGIWDEKNNKPILRKGTTATHPNKDYNGKKEFMIDAACFPGSSGSPVLLFNGNGYTDKKGETYLGTRMFFLGALYAGPQHTATGEIQIVTVPNFQKPIAFSRIPNNLGLVIKAESVMELESLFK